MSAHKLSLLAAVFININIMLGTGVFVNTVLLAKKVGALGGLLYLSAGLLMLPLIFCIARLTQKHPGGNFYTFGASISPFWGFISAWGYFFGKLATASLGIHVFNMFLQNVFPFLSTINTFILDAFIISLFVCLNLLHVKTGIKIQYFFLATKLTPLLFVVFSGLHYAQLINIQAPHLIWSGVPVAIPLVLFCFLGFEATCSLAAHIQDAKKNAPRAILISFGIVVLLAILYQTLFYASMGSELAAQDNYTQAFPILVESVLPSLKNLLVPLFSVGIALSAVGGAYGILYSNAWNLYALAQHNHIIGASYVSRLNAHAIPYLCIITEGIVCVLHLLLSQGAQVPLQYTSTLSSVTAYTISIMGLFLAERSLLSIVGLTSCGITIVNCLRAFVYTSLDPLARFLAILLLGIVMFLITYQSAQLKRHQSK